MYEVVLLGFAQVSIITAVTTGSFVGSFCHSGFIPRSFDDWEIILIEKGRNK